MLLSTSFKRKVAATIGAAVGFILLHEATTIDSRDAGPQALAQEITAESGPVPGGRLRFVASAYCKGTVTATGVAPRTGIAAADSQLLPSGSVIRLDNLPAKYNGVYTIMDNGPEVQGRELDLYMWSCHEALSFGRRAVQVTVLRMGWNPRASTPNLIYKLFHINEAALPPPEAPLESRPLATSPDGLPAVQAPAVEMSRQ